MRYSKELEPAEERALQTQELELATKLEILAEKIRMQTERAEQLIVRSPIDGIVISWDVEKMLRSRPISTGQVLLEVADLTQPMYLELDLPEKREGHLDDYVLKQGLESGIRLVGRHLHLGDQPRSKAQRASGPIECLLASRSGRRTWCDHQNACRPRTGAAARTETSSRCQGDRQGSLRSASKRVRFLPRNLRMVLQVFLLTPHET